MHRIAGFVAVLFGLAAAAQAQAPAQRAGWQFALTPYVWFAGISGDVELPSGRHDDREFSADFGDILSNLSFAAMLAAEARNGRFGIAADLMTLTLEQDVSTRGILFRDGESRVTTTSLGLVGFYRLLDTPGGSIDAGAGIRAWWVSARISLDGRLGVERSREVSRDWIDPILMLRGHARLAERVGISLYGDIGGFGVGSELTWQVLGTLDYRANDWLELRAGWRHLAIDFRSGRLNLDVAMTGPIIAATFRF